MPHKGTQAEQLVARYLRRHGYTILSQNLEIGRLGELDIIAEKDGVISFVEVRSKSTSLHGAPAETVGYRKQDKLRKLANTYLEGHFPDRPARFDVASVVISKNGKRFINYIEDAFE